jgi:hypothetical protein
MYVIKLMPKLNGVSLNASCQAHSSARPRETLHARLALCSVGDTFGDIAATQQTLQPYTARCTRRTTCLACPWSFMLAKVDSYSMRGFKSCVRRRKELRELVALKGFGTGRQEMLLERGTDPKLSRRTCRCGYGLQPWGGKIGGRREQSPTRNP